MEHTRALLLLSGHEIQIDDIKMGLISNHVGQLDVLDTHRLSERDKTAKYDLIVISCETLSESLMDHFLSFASKMSGTQFLILADQISIYAYRQVGSMRNITTVQTPMDFSVYEGVVKQLLIQAPLSTMDRCPRFVTNEPARMVVMDTGLLIPTRMRNYSTSGAFLEYKGISVRVGQNVQLNLSNQEIKPGRPQWKLSAKVIWTREGDGRLSSARGLGVKFHTEAEIAV